MKPMWWVQRIIAEQSLSMDARGLLIWFGTRPAGWRYSVEEALTASGFGRQKYQKVFASLKEAGWVVTDYKRDRRGRIKFTRVTIRDTAARKAENQPSGKAVTERMISRPPDRKAENQPRLSLVIDRDGYPPAPGMVLTGRAV